MEEVVSKLFYDYTSIYLFSALLQANAAILAIVGIFGIFKIQSLYTKIDFLKNGLTFPDGRNNTSGWSPFDIHTFDYKTIANKETCITEVKDSGIQLMLSSWLGYEKQILSIRPRIVSSTILLGFGIIVDAIGIIFSKVIHSLIYQTELIILLLMLIFEIILIMHTILNIKEILGNNQ